MRKIKKFLEFMTNNGVEVISVNDVPFSKINRTISRGSFDFQGDDFLVNLSCDGSEKLVSISQQLFIDYIKEEDKNLSDYIDKLSTIDDIFTELKEFGWDFQTAIQSFVNQKYDCDKFDQISSLEEDDRDDIGGWTEEDQGNYDDLIDQDND
jgi:hypothetical protein